MIDTQTTQDLSDTARFIAEPVAGDLDRVVANMKTLAEESGLAGDDMVAQAVVSGGKKVRPTVTLLAGALRSTSPGSPEQDRLVKMATAVELLHIASLIHDDTVDKADTRRGQATVSSMFGPDVAVLLGDYVFAASATFVCDTGNIRVIRRFSETIMELARGELAERFSTHDWSQSIDDYKRRIYDKTASLICTAAESGGVLSGAPEEQNQALRSFGYNVGMAFPDRRRRARFHEQRGGAGASPPATTCSRATLTLPALLFAERHPREAVVKRLLDGSREEADLHAMVAHIRESSAIDESLAALDGYRNAARAALSLLPNARPRESLEALIDFVTDRRN